MRPETVQRRRKERLQPLVCHFQHVRCLRPVHAPRGPTTTARVVRRKEGQEDEGPVDKFCAHLDFDARWRPRSAATLLLVPCVVDVPSARGLSRPGSRMTPPSAPTATRAPTAAAPPAPSFTSGPARRSEPNPGRAASAACEHISEAARVTVSEASGAT